MYEKKTIIFIDIDKSFKVWQVKLEKKKTRAPTAWIIPLTCNISKLLLKECTIYNTNCFVDSTHNDNIDIKKYITHTLFFGEKKKKQDSIKEDYVTKKGLSS